MCSRYYIDDEMMREMEKIIGSVDRRCYPVKMGDIYPSQSGLVLKSKKTGLSLDTMQWGFPKYDGKGLIINARSETVKEKRTFQGSIFSRRCVIPARHYYEWDKSKTKVTCSAIEAPILYMAGCYQRFEDQDRFVILTTEANSSVNQIHDRMPLILEQEELEDWLCGNEMWNDLLRKTPPMMQKFQEYEQQTLEFL